SLTTIGTPHNGTTLADAAMDRGGALLIEGLRSVVSLEGFRDLTTRACRDFNARAEPVEASNGVWYQVYASAERRGQVFLPLQPSWTLINGTEGPNDGLVSLQSQRWKASLTAGSRVKGVVQRDFPVAADHLNEVGWWDPQEVGSIGALFGLAKQVE